MASSIKERILSVYKKQRPDKIPVSIYNRYFRYGETERLARNLGLGILDFYPVVSLLAPPWHVKQGYVSEVKNASFNIHLSWENGQQIETRTYETPVGTISQQTVKDPTYDSDWITRHYLESPEDYKIMQYIVENTVFRSQEKAIRQRTRDLGDDGVVLGRVDRNPYQKLLIELADPQKFLIDLYLEPDAVVSLLQIIDHRLNEQLEMALNVPVDVIWSPDNVTADMTPPASFEKYCLPFYQKYGSACKTAGKIYAVHMDGRTAALKDLIAQCPINVIESFSLAEMAGDVPVAEAKQLWPDKALCLNFPASLCDKPKKEIIRFLDRTVAEFEDVPFMIQISEDIPPDSYYHVLPVLCEYFK